MAPSLRAFQLSSESTRRERKAIALLTLAFIVLSAITHVLVGGAVLPTFKQPPKEPEVAQTIILESPRPHPSPTVAPTPTPTPRTHIVTTPRPETTSIARGTPGPRFSPPSVIHGGTARPGGGGEATAGPGSFTTPGPDITAAPAPSFAPCRFVHKVEPEYPDWAKQAGITGTVVVILEIGPDGHVLSARAGESSGNASLDQAAVSAARASMYACPPVGGRTDSELYEVIYSFRLD